MACGVSGMGRFPSAATLQSSGRGIELCWEATRASTQAPEWFQRFGERLHIWPVATAPRRAARRGPAARRRSATLGVPSGPSRKPRYAGQDEPCPEYAPKQFDIKMVY